MDGEEHDAYIDARVLGRHGRIGAKDNLILSPYFQFGQSTRRVPDSVASFRQLQLLVHDIDDLVLEVTDKATSQVDLVSATIR